MAFLKSHSLALKIKCFLPPFAFRIQCGHRLSSFYRACGLLLCCFIAALNGDIPPSSPIQLNFSDLSEAMLQWEEQKSLPPTLLAAINQTVSIRGFLYYKEPLGWVLAASPNLKSCCIHSTVHQPLIYLADDASQIHSTHAITLQGHLSLLSKDPLSFQLTSFSLQPADHTSFLLFSLLGFVVICLLFAKSNTTLAR